MASPILTSSALNQTEVRREIFMEMVHENTLSWLMGTSDNAVIKVQNQPKRAGDTITFPFLNALDDAYKVDSEQLQGNEEDPVFASDSVVVRPVRYAVKEEDFDITEQRAPFSTFEQFKPLLVTKGMEHMRDNIIDALGDVTEGRNQNRYLYGAADSNWNATHATALANIDTTNDKMTTNVIRAAVKKAKLGGTTAGVAKSRKIRPYKVEMDNGAISSVFVMLMHTEASDQLMDDTAYQNAALYRSEAGAPKLVDGSRFRGYYAGAMLYEVDELERLADNTAPGGLFSYTRTDLTSAGNSTSAVVHNLLLGAQAVGVGQAMLPAFRMEEEDYGRIKGIGVTELYGVTKLVFDSVDNSVVHVFTSKGA